jgi:zinc transport system permease protein
MEGRAVESLVSAVEIFVDIFSSLFPDGSIFAYGFNVRALLGIVLVALVCGSIGGLVVGNRMAFFSDALAHCAFAGFALGVVIFLLAGIAPDRFREYLTLIMVGFGIVIGLLIAFVREQTGLASDTVIGVFFAGAIGFGAIFTGIAANRRFLNIESIIFGDPQSIDEAHLIYLIALLLITGVFLAWRYNDLVISSVSPSLALSRNVPVRLCRYLFIVLLGLIVNLGLQVVGILLINALLIVPAATAANVCRNMRQLFWCSIILSLVSGIGGQLLSWEISTRARIPVGTGGMIVVLSVLFFVVSILVAPWWRGRTAVAMGHA